MKRVLAGVFGLLLSSALLVGALVALLRHHSSAVVPAPLPVEQHWDVVGVVKRVDRAADYRADPGTGPATPSYRVGPERIQLDDGRVLDVPANTPGSKNCVELMTDREKLEATGLPAPSGLSDSQVRLYGTRNLNCVVIAALDARGLVTRFGVLDTSVPSVAFAGHAGVGGVLAMSGNRYLTQSGYAFALDPHVGGDCAPAKVGVPFLRRWGSGAYIDAHRGTIVDVECLGRA